MKKRTIEFEIVGKDYHEMNMLGELAVDAMMDALEFAALKRGLPRDAFIGDRSWGDTTLTEEEQGLEEWRGLTADTRRTEIVG